MLLENEKRGKCEWSNKIDSLFIF